MLRKRQKTTLLRIAAGAIMFAAALLIPAVFSPVRIVLFFLAYLVCGLDVLYSALRNMVRGQVFDENFLMALATIGAFALGEYPEGVAVMLFYQVGEWFQRYAVGRSRKSIAQLMNIRPDRANRLRGGKMETLPPEEVHPGDIIVVGPGERVALDGVVTEGSALLDTSALTGESVPRPIRAGESIFSGCISLNARLLIKVTREASESTVAKILDMVENASGRKSRSEAFITRFARYYTPAVVGLAVLLAVVVPLATGDSFVPWIHRALLFLVVSCPCALVISIPLSFFGGIGGASRAGVLVKGGNYLEALARTDTVAFDKTGTLTRGCFSVAHLLPEKIGPDELLELATLAEQISNHPISLSLKRAYGRDVDAGRVSDARELSGQGIRALVDGREVYVGNAALMTKLGFSPARPIQPGTVVHVAVGGEYAGCIIIRDEIKPDAADAVARLKQLGIRKTVMLTGDTPEAAREVAQQLGIDEYYAGLMPLDKVAKAEDLLAETARRGGRLAFVGDGINDAPVLSRADVGIAMGALGSDAAIEAADVVIMDDHPAKIAAAIRIARKTLSIARQNILFALGVKFVILTLGAAGIATMWEAVFADVGVSIIAILNALRALQVKKAA